MTGPNPAENLVIVTEHINELAGNQRHAAGEIAVANRMTAGVASRVADTHGLVCFPTSSIMSTAAAAREAAGQALFKVSTQMAERLDTAASNYNSVDYMQGRIIDRNM